MKKLLVSLAALCLPFLAAADNDVTNDEQNWIAAVQPFYKEAKAAGITSLVGLVKDADAGTSPVKMMFRKDTRECIFIVAARNNFASKVVQSLPRFGGAELARAAAVAHEYGHCLHNLAIVNKEPGHEALPPMDSPQSEAMADVFALGWFALNRPNDFDRARKFFIDMRKLPAQDDKYDTRNHLVAAHDLRERMAAQPASAFEYAKTLVLGAPLPQSTATAVSTASTTVATAN